MQRGWVFGLAAIVFGFSGCAGAPAIEEEEATVTVTPTTEVAPQACIPPQCPILLDHEVRISPTVLNSTTRSTAEITPIILDAIRTKLHSDPDIDVDEGSEPTNTNHALMVRGRLAQITFAGGNLTVKVELAIFTYPGLALKGSLSKTLTMQGVTPPNIPAQNQLMSLAASLATQSFINSIDAFE